MARPLLRDLTGQRYGRLKVIGRVPNRNGKVVWKCRCDCGGTAVCQTFSLIFGDTTSCGCYRRERMIERNRGENCD